MATTKLYPNIAPDYRLDQARAFQREMSGEVEKRARLLRKSEKWRGMLRRSSNTLRVCTVTLGSVSIGLVSTGIGLPAALPPAAAGILVGIVDLGIGPAQRRLEKKALRHTQLATLAESKLVTISRLLSRGLDDGALSDSEFQAFADEKEAWIKAKNEINRTAETELQKLADEFRSRLAKLEAVASLTPSAPPYA